MDSHEELTHERFQRKRKDSKSCLSKEKLEQGFLSNYRNGFGVAALESIQRTEGWGW